MRTLPGLILGLALGLGLPPEAGAGDPVNPANGRPIVYQVMTRLFGNKNSSNKAWGTIEENGVGKFSDFDKVALDSIRDLGITHIWYTGVPHHAVIRDYTDFGISNDDPDVVKGRAGSPYAVKDYYNVNPDLADDPSRRLEEFQALIERTHEAGMKVVIDIVPNHVARRYESISAPPGVEGFGTRDDTTREYARDNNFYYIPGEDFRVPEAHEGYRPLGDEAHHLADGRFEESPAKWTGNGARKAQPAHDDWYETVKINFGVRPDGSHDFPSLPDALRGAGPELHAEFWRDKDIPDSWVKFRDIALYWTRMGVDGFRFDMAEMVPYEFWSYLNSSILGEKSDAFLLAEIYQPAIYRDYIDLGLMGFLYDKVGLYDALKAVIREEAGTGALVPVIEDLRDIDAQLLTFLENHDEQRIASEPFAGDARKGLPAMVVSAMLRPGPVMVYFGQELGEPGDGDPGFGDPTRTTIFDYWGVPSHQRWMNGGKFDGGRSTEVEKNLRQAYRKILRIAGTNPAMLGQTHVLERAEISREPWMNAGDSVFAFARWAGDERLIVASNFSESEEAVVPYKVPPEILHSWSIDQDKPLVRLHDYLGSEDERYMNLDADGGASLTIRLAPLQSVIYRIGVPQHLQE